MNIKNTTSHHRRKPTPLIYCLRSQQGQFCSTQFLNSFLKLFREMNSFFFYRNDFPIFWVLIGSAFRTMKHCVHRRYPTISIFSEFLLLCYLCKNISYNFTRLALFYLKHFYSMTIDVSMMNRWWPIFFLEFFIKWQFVILNKLQTSFIFHVNA